MAGERIRLQVQQRERLGSAESRRLRRDGLIPGVLYGNGDPVAICVEERKLRGALTGSGGLHTILDVVVGGDGGKAHPSILKDYQQDPLRGTVTHVDLHEVRLDKPIQAAVTIQVLGESAGTKAGGVLQQPLREVTVEALPMEVPEHIDIDVSELEIGDSLRVGDLPALEGVTYVDDPDSVVVSVTMPTRVVEPEVEEEEAVEGEEGVAVEGEEAPEGAAEEAPGEPEGEPGTVEG